MKNLLFLIFLSSQLAIAIAASEQVEQLVRGSLIDPYSARFEKITNFKNGNSCGYVNAKNSFGGYVGRKPFVIIKKSVDLDWYSYDSACKFAENPAKVIRDTKKLQDIADETTYAQCRARIEDFTDAYKPKFFGEPIEAGINELYIEYHLEDNKILFNTNLYAKDCGEKFLNELEVKLKAKNDLDFQSLCLSKNDDFLHELKTSGRLYKRYLIIRQCGIEYVVRTEEKGHLLFEENNANIIKIRNTNDCEKFTFFSKSGDAQTREYWAKEAQLKCNEAK